MKRKIRYNGDSAVVALPPGALELLKVDIGDFVNVIAKNGKIEITKIKKDKKEAITKLKKGE